MKRVILLLALLASLSTLTTVQACSLNANLINQDPYPAIPGDYVKLVFQLDGVENPDCGMVSFSLNPKFPFSLDPGVQNTQTFNSGTYSRNYSSVAVIPYKVRVDSDALDGQNLVEVTYTNSNSFSKIQDFNIEVSDVRTDFEVSIDDYDQTQNKLTFSILNIGKNDVESVVVEVPKQETLEVKGGNRQIIGSLNSNDDSSFSFEASPADGSISLVIYYTDKTGVRRSLEKSVKYESSYFTNRIRDQKSSPTYLYVIGALILLIIIWRVLVRRKRNKNKK